MKKFILLLAASALATTPLAAQHAGHTMPMPEKPAAKKAPAKKKPAAKKAPAKKVPAKKAPAKKKPAVKKVPAKQPPDAEPAADPHAGHVMPDEPPAADPHAGHAVPSTPPASDPHAGHAMPSTPPASDPHAGHAMPSEQPTADMHAGHDMSATAIDVPVAPPPPEAFRGPENAADAIWGEAAVKPSREFLLRKEHGGTTTAKLFMDRVETRVRDGRNGYLLDLQAWYGGDIDKLWLKSEVEGAWGNELEHAEVQALWSHAIGPWFDFQAGARFDPQPGPNRTHLVVGVQGLAPCWWEVEGAIFLSNKGELTGRAEAEYDLRITQKLILQPRGEVDLSAQDVPELGIGAGLTEASLGLRLRYQISPLVAPYIGVEYEHAFGETRDFRRAEGEKAGGFNLLAGVRLWF